MTKHILTKVACYFILLIAICPIVGYYCDWYISAIPVALILFPLLSKDKTLVILSVAALYVFLHWWLLYRDWDFALYFFNGIIVFVPVLISYYASEFTDNRFKSNYLQFAAILFGITSITTIIGLEIFPGACRELASGTAVYDTERYTRINIGGFEFIYSLVLFIPVVIWSN